MPAVTPCVPCCTTTQSVNIPGPSGNDGAPGASGINAYSFIQLLAVVIPPIGTTVTVNVDTSLWMVVGQFVVATGPAHFQVSSIPNSGQVVLTFLGYPGDLAASTTLNIGTQISPAGEATPVFVETVVSQQDITSTSLVDITALVVPCAANSTYAFEAIINCSAATGTDGAKFGVNYNSGTQGTIDCVFLGMTNTTTHAAATRLQAWNTAGPAVCTTSAAVTQHVISGYFTTSTSAANFSVQALKLVSQTLSIFPGSWLRVTKVA